MKFTLPVGEFSLTFFYLFSDMKWLNESSTSISHMSPVASNAMPHIKVSEENFPVNAFSFTNQSDQSGSQINK